MNINEDNLFRIEDSFIKKADIPSLLILESILEFVPLVTIAIPTFKREKKLKNALDSAIHQLNYDHYDIVIIDNNPERNCKTESLIRSYNNTKISYYKNARNIGMTGNLNRCFELSKGKYITLLHDDDLLMPTFLSDCMRIINDIGDVGILKPFSYKWIEEKDIVPIDLAKMNTSNQYIYRVYDYDNYNKFILGPPTGCIFNKNDFINLGGFNDAFYPIMDFVLAIVFSQRRKVYQYTKVLSIYRIAVNESLNLTTLIDSYKGVYILTKQLLLKYNVPRPIINKFLSIKLTLSIEGYKSYNNNFDFNLNKIGLKKPNSIEILLYKILIRLLDNILLKLKVKHKF